MASDRDYYNIKELKQHLKEVKSTADLFALLGQMLDYMEAQEEPEPMGESPMMSAIKKTAVKMAKTPVLDPYDLYEIDEPKGMGIYEEKILGKRLEPSIYKGSRGAGKSTAMNEFLKGMYPPKGGKK